MRKYIVTGPDGFAALPVVAGFRDEDEVIYTSFGTFNKSDMRWIVDDRFKIREISNDEYFELRAKWPIAGDGD